MSCLCQQHPGERSGQGRVPGRGKGDLTLGIDSARHCAGHWRLQYNKAVGEFDTLLSNDKSTLLSFIHSFCLSFIQSCTQGNIN